jgi:Right handed beta helix region
VQVRAAGISGQGPVQDLSLFPVELFPFFLMDHQLYFADVRAFPTVDGTFGGNVGFGYRLYNPSLDRVFGISGWYDADGTRDPYFQQFGVSLETYGRWWDWRANVYVPFGQTFDQTSLGAIGNSARFVGNNVVYNELQGYIAAMTGFDMELGVPIPGKFAEAHNVRLYGGGYYYVDSQGDHITGGSARLQANLYQGVDGSVQVTNDNFFNTRAFLGISWTFGPLHRSELSDPSQQARLGEHVTRNYTVLAPTRSQVDPNVTAIDPITDTPYTFAHVNSAAAAGGNGTINSPFQTIAAAQATGATIVFVHANSVFNGADATISMNAGQALLGDGGGLQHTLSVPTGTIVLPHASGSTSLPVLQSSTGDAITLAPNAILSGFTINNPAGNGLFGNGVSNSTIENVTINNAGNNGILLVNSANSVQILNTTINGSQQNGLWIEGGNANITFTGTISGSQNYDALVFAIGGGTVDLTGMQLPGSGSQGVLLLNNAGTVDFNNLTVLNSAGRGIDIENESGAVQFAGTTTVSGAAGESVNIFNQFANGSVTFDNLAIDHREGTGLSIGNSAGTVAVTGTTNITNEIGSNASGISIANSSVNTTFTGAVTVSNAVTNPGVSLTSNTGTTTFSTLNVTSVNGTGLFANDAGTLVINSAHTAGAGGTISSVGGTAADIESTNMDVYLAVLSSNNAPVGLKLIGSSGTFFVTGNASNAVGTGGTIQDDTVGAILTNAGTVGLVGMTLNSNGVGIQAQNVQSLGLANTTISGSSSYGIDALNVGTLNVVGSTFTGNGAASIRSQYDQQGAYTINVESSTLTSSSADNLLIATQPIAEPSSLTLTVQNTAFTNGASNTAGINVAWNGTLDTTIASNSFAGTGGSNTGVLINNGTSTYMSTILVQNNAFAANGGSDTGFHFITGGPTSLTVTGNSVQFGGANGTGLEFSLGSSSSVSIASNAIYDNVGGGTGMLFDSVTGPSTIAISNNSFSVPNGGGPDRGIIFSSVTDPVSGTTTYMPNLSSSANNTITGAATPFSVPASTTSGGILVNGTVMP